MSRNPIGTMARTRAEIVKMADRVEDMRSEVRKTGYPSLVAVRLETSEVALDWVLGENDAFPALIERMVSDELRGREYNGVDDAVETIDAAVRALNQAGSRPTTKPLEEVELAIRKVLMEMENADMSVEDRLSVETWCQRIHAAFGGDSAHDIYPARRGDSS